MRDVALPLICPAVGIGRQVRIDTADLIAAADAAVVAAFGGVGGRAGAWSFGPAQALSRQVRPRPRMRASFMRGVRSEWRKGVTEEERAHFELFLPT